MEQLINEIYNLIRKNYHYHLPQVFNKYYENDYSKKYVIIIKNCEDDFIIYQAIKKGSTEIKTSSIYVDRNMLNSLI